MTTYNVTCGDGKQVRITAGHPDDELNRALRNLKRYYGLDPELVLSAMFQGYSSAKVTFDIDPGHMHDMLMAFWTGYSMALKGEDAA